MSQIGVTGSATKRGIPAATVAWGAHSLTIFTEIRKTPTADTGETLDNSAELLVITTTNPGFKLSFSCKPAGDDLAAVKAIAADLPFPMDELTITCAGDAQVAGTAYVDSASGRYSPEGEFVVDIECSKYETTFATIS
jgi:hypothetical protein